MNPKIKCILKHSNVVNISAELGQAAREDRVHGGSRGDDGGGNEEEEPAVAALHPARGDRSSVVRYYG